MPDCCHIGASLTRYHLLLCLPLSLLFPHPPHAIHASTLHAIPPSPNGSNFSMVITISLINYPETHLPRFTPSLFCYLLINFPLSHHFFPSTPNTSPGVYFDHSLINQFCSFFFPKKKILCQHFSLPQQHPSTCHPVPFSLSKFPTLSIFPSPTSLHLTTISFPNISRSQHFSSTQFILRQCFPPPFQLSIFLIPIFLPKILNYILL